MPKKKNIYLKCNRSAEGPFSFERVIVIVDTNGNLHYGFFLKEVFYNDNKFDKLKIEICKTEGEKSLVWVPSQCCAGFGFINEPKIWVHKEQLIEL